MVETTTEDTKAEANGLKLRANEAYKKRDFVSAITLYHEALALDANNTSILGNISAICFEEGRFHECIKICDDVLRLGPDEKLHEKLKLRREKASLALSKDGPVKYVLGSLPHKGKGLIAKRRIKAGEIIVSEVPLVLVNLKNARQDTEKQFRALDKEKKETFLGLCNSFSEDEKSIHDIFRSNASNVNETLSGLFPLMSRINHSCYPNANYTWREDLKEQQVIAIRTIMPGEEITDTYLPDEFCDTRAERQKRLWNTHRFICKCSDLCGLPEEESEKYDAIFEDIKLAKNRVNAIGERFPVELKNQALVGEFLNECIGLVHKTEEIKVQVNFLYLVKALNVRAHMIAEKLSEAYDLGEDVCQHLKRTGGKNHQLTIVWESFLHRFWKDYGNKQKIQNSCSHFKFTL